MKNILLIEDDLDIQKIYSEKLTGAGYNVLLATSCMKGLKIIKDDKPKLVLLDIMLPGEIDGIDFLEILKKDNVLKLIPVIVLTNLNTEKDCAMKTGANDYLIKVDTDLDDLVKKVGKNITSKN